THTHTHCTLSHCLTVNLYTVDDATLQQRRIPFIFNGKLSACLSSALQVGCSAFACLESPQCVLKQKYLDLVKVPKHFPNRYYSTLLQSLMECDEDTVGVVRRRGSNRAAADSETDGQDSFRWPLGPPTFKIQPSLHNRDPNHLFARKRSVEK
uniref:Stanniocalcin n=1 Tax=Astyanax mexicanus TaxID=7994 RepID=A0A3B1IRP6_ASTMX